MVYVNIPQNQGIGIKQSFKAGLISSFPITGVFGTPSVLPAATNSTTPPGQDNSSTYTNLTNLWTSPVTATVNVEISINWTNNDAGTQRIWLYMLENVTSTLILTGSLLSQSQTRTDTYSYQLSATSGNTYSLQIASANAANTANLTYNTYWGVWWY